MADDGNGTRSLPDPRVACPSWSLAESSCHQPAPDLASLSPPPCEEPPPQEREKFNRWTIHLSFLSPPTALSSTDKQVARHQPLGRGLDQTTAAYEGRTLTQNHVSDLKILGNKTKLKENRLCLDRALKSEIVGFQVKVMEHSFSSRDRTKRTESFSQPCTTRKLAREKSSCCNEREWKFNRTKAVGPSP